MKQTESILVLEKAEKIYTMGSEKVHALAGIDVTFNKGCFTAIMGSSGSGKSTLMNVLGCLDRLSAGKYLIRGENTRDLNDNKLSLLRLKYLGFIFQSFNLIPQLSVKQNIELPLYYLGWDPVKSRNRAIELAEKVGLGDRVNHRPNELSGGQMQRVAIARSLANEPDIILADEPTGNLDTETGTQIMKMLSDLHGQGKTIIMVTHETDIAQYADTIIHMRDGAIERIETAGIETAG